MTALLRETGAARTQRGLCSLVICDTPPVVRDKFGLLWCQKHYDVGQQQNVPVKARSSS